MSWLQVIGRTPRVHRTDVADRAAADRLMTSLRARDDVTAVGLTSTYRRAGGVPTVAPRTRTDPLLRSQWGLPAVGATSAWRTSAGARVLVAVVDDGVDVRHPDLAGNVVAGWNVMSRSPRVDAGAHGTHVAGIIAARLGNGIGGSGLAPRAVILPVDVFASTFTTDAAVASGIIYAANRGARVINLSLGGPDPSPVLRQAVRYAQSKGAVVVAAAGNEGDVGNPVEYPAGFAGVIGVGAVDRTMDHPTWSNTGRYVDLVAPGVDITSLAPGRRYATASGTSMATPFVSAAAALVRSRYPRWTAAQVTSLLQTSARDLGAPGYDRSFGFGLVSAGTALGSTPGTPPAVAVAPEPDAGRVSVTWRAPRFPGPTGIGRYRVELSVDGGATWSIGRDVAVTARGTVFSQVAVGSVVRARVAAVGARTGLRSPWATTTPAWFGGDAPSDPALAVPLELETAGAITPAGDVDWYAVAAGPDRTLRLSGSRLAYQVDVFSAGPVETPWQTVSAPGTDGVVTLPAGGPWLLRVTALDPVASSPWPYRLTVG